MSIRINSIKKDPAGWLGAMIMCLLVALAVYRLQRSGLLYFALLLVREVLAVWFFLTRRPPEGTKGTWKVKGLVYGSAILPLCYFGQAGAVAPAFLLWNSLLAIVGFTISTLALLELGQSFGVTPANRGIVKTGIYRYVSHPMYVGYWIGETGMVLLNPVNFGIWICSASLYLVRMRLEGKALGAVKTKA